MSKYDVPSMTDGYEARFPDIYYNYLSSKITACHDYPKNVVESLNNINTCYICWNRSFMKEIFKC